MEENKATENLELENKQGQEQEKDTYTKDEVLKLLQSEADRRVTQALNKQKKQYEQKLSLSKLDGDAREKAEKDNRIAELEEQLKEFTVLQNKNEVVKTLSARGLNPLFADLVDIGEDVEENQKKIEQLDKLFKQAVSEEVKKRLASGTPKSGGSTGEITKQQFAKMTVAQQSKLYMENPELYKKLTN